MDSKKKKILSYIIAVLVLAGVGVGAYFVVQDNKRIEREQEEENGPFLGILPEQVDSLFQNLSAEEQNNLGQIYVFKDSLSAKKSSFAINCLETQNLNQFRQLSDSNDISGINILDLNAYVDSSLLFENLLVNSNSAIDFVLKIYQQTGIRLFKVNALSKINSNLNQEELERAGKQFLDSLFKQGVLFVLNNNSPYQSKVDFSDDFQDSTVFNPKKLHLNLKQNSEIKTAVKKQVLALKMWSEKQGLTRDTTNIDLNMLAQFWQSKITRENLSLTDGNHDLLNAERVYYFVNGSVPKSLRDFRKFKKSVRSITQKELKDFSKPLLIVNNGSLDSNLVQLINSSKKAIFIDLKSDKLASQIEISKVQSIGELNNPKTQKYAFESLAGAGTFLKNHLFNEKGIATQRQLLSYGNPIDYGLHPDTLKKMRYLIQSAMNGRAFPGCEVIVVKEGNIVYEKYFGKQKYESSPVIDENDVYDIASMTKVVATTMVAMKLYEDGFLDLDAPLKTYLPDTINKYLPFKKNTIENITIRELLIHKSGLPAGGPILQYMQYTNKKKEIGRFDKYYCDQADDSLFTVEVAEGVFMDKEYQDSMWIKQNSMYINPNKPYKYSDVNMNLLYRIEKSIIEKEQLVQKKKNDSLFNGFSQYLNEKFFEPLELERTTYMPRRKIPLKDIVPTEKENFWRKQLIHGYVHDPSAALLGGTAGNAGIFSNVKELAVLFQMLEQGGSYKGVQYLKPETIQLFISKQEYSHRGLGFNKPDLTSSTFGVSDWASKNTYGHTGFTGTCVWTDPENDLIYIFLSNRVYPKFNKRIYKYGVRKNLHHFLYKSMLF